MKTLEISLTDTEAVRLAEVAATSRCSNEAQFVEQFLRYSPGSPTQPRVQRYDGKQIAQWDADDGNR